jgi:hypothetical protein
MTFETLQGVRSPLRPRDDISRVNFCIWVLQNIANGAVDPHLIIFSDEAWFNIHGYVCSQNFRQWSTENPRLIHEVLSPLANYTDRAIAASQRS